MPQFEVLSFDMGIHGWIALVIAVIGIAGLHLGLMWLARKPHDDRFHPEEAAGDDPADRVHSADPAHLPHRGRNRNF